MSLSGARSSAALGTGGNAFRTIGRLAVRVGVQCGQEACCRDESLAEHGFRRALGAIVQERPREVVVAFAAHVCEKAQEERNVSLHRLPGIAETQREFAVPPAPLDRRSAGVLSKVAAARLVVQAVV